MRDYEAEPIKLVEATSGSR